MKKVLIITYYWPPSGGAGVQRWLKFVKYLRNFGWEPLVYTPENPEMPVVDTSLALDVPEGIQVIKTPIREPYNFYKLFIGRKKDEKISTGFLAEKKKPGLLEKIAVWIRGNLFIPDARMFWINPSVKFLNAFLDKNHVDVIVSTGPPHSMHLIAMKIKILRNVPWLADFRDPWTNIDFYDDLMLTARADKKHHLLEKQVLENANAVVVVSNTIKNEFGRILGNDSGISVITNGYDDDDIYRGRVNPDSKFSLAHIGTLVPSRNPEVLWKVLSEMVNENTEFSEDLEIKLVGKVDYTANESINKYGLNKFVKKINYLPHSEVIKFQQQSQVLLLLANRTKNAKGILTGKFFEYLSARRPILAIGPRDGDIAEILASTKAGKIAEFDDALSIRNIISGYYSLFKSGKLICESEGVEKYSRKELTAELSNLLNSITAR